MEPLQIFYRNEQSKTPFDIVWDLKDLSKLKFYDGLYIIDHLATHVMTWIDKLIERKAQKNLSLISNFVVKGRNILKKVKAIGEETLHLFENVGHVVGIVNAAQKFSGTDQNNIQHNDQENETLKNNDLNKDDFVKVLLENELKNHSQETIIAKFILVCKDRISESTFLQNNSMVEANKEKAKSFEEFQIWSTDKKY